MSGRRDKVRGQEGQVRRAEGLSATLEDVARHAGVSPATVSRCLNSPNSVRPNKREKVTRAIQELNYVPHGAARALASRKSRMIGAVFPSLDTDLFGGALEAFQGEVAQGGYTVVVASSAYDPAQEQRHIRNLLESGVDALMLVGAERSEEAYRLIRAKGIPYVVIWVSQAPYPHNLAENLAPDLRHDCVGFDNWAAAADVTDYLLSLGHRHFAMISGTIAGNDRARLRLEGVRAALKAKSLDLAPDHLHERPFQVEDGRQAFRCLMQGETPPTAIICGAEPFAYGALFEAKEMGLSVPEDVSVVGFDDMWLAAHLSPALTTVRTPRTKMGRQAARFLLSRLMGQAVADPPPLETKLVIRKSTGPPPGSSGL
ncbi:MAG: LacI family DNA-binding transcriptional regulator [Pseudomonadota bacterium]